MSRLQAKLLPHQMQFVQSNARYPALIAGYGAGKTEALVMRVLRFISGIPNAVIGVYEPTVDLIKRILYPRFEEIFGGAGLIYTLNKTDGILEVFMPPPIGKCQIIFRSMDNYSRIIGYETHHAILDEIDTLPKDKAFEVWVRVLARNRKGSHTQSASMPKKNTVGVTTTPEGFNFTYELWGKTHKDNPDYELIRGRTADNWHLPSDYIDALRRTYPPNLIDAYLNGEWVNLVGNTVYSSFDRYKNHTQLTLDDWPAHAPLHIGADFNVVRMAAVTVLKGEDGHYYVVDEMHKLRDTPALIETINARYPYATRRATIYPDASGRSRKTVDASKSDIRLLREAHFRVNAPKKNPPVKDRVISVNTLFCDATGDRRLFVNTDRCPALTEALERQVWDENGNPVKDGTEDILDALGYVMTRIAGLNRPVTAVTRMRMV